MEDHQVRRGPNGALVLLAALLLAGCGATSTSAGNIPVATLDKQPPAGSTGAGSAGSGSTGAAPRVSRPIDSAALTSDVCAALSASQRGRLGIGEGTARTTPVGPSCYWKFVEEDSDRVDIAAQLKNPNGMSDLYDQETEFGYFEPVEVAGFPGLYAGISDNRSRGDCNLHIALNDQVTVMVSARMSTSGPRRSTPCAVVESFAEAMLATLS